MSNSHTIGLAALIALCLAAPTQAEDRGVRVPPALAEAWIAQLTPGSGVVPGYTRPDLAHPRGVAVPVGDGLRGSHSVPVAPYRSRDIKDDPHDRRTDYTGSIAAAPAGPPTAAAAAALPAGPAPVTVAAPAVSLASAAPARRAMKRVDAIDPVFLPQRVDYPSDRPAGTVVIDTRRKFLYLVEGGGKARRYGVGVGKPGFGWAGSHTVSRKQEWPTWTPPAQMRAREKKKGKILPVQMKGGPKNPLGARALYLGATLYRIHGTNQPWSIGKAVSSGCIRMRNEDVTDLYERVPVGTKVIVL